MKVLLTGKNSKNITELVKSLGFDIVTADPDVVITYGGDGTLLTVERQYPGIPKLPIRDSLVCQKCPKHEEKVVLQNLRDGKLNLKDYKKLETTLLYKKFYALNDFVVRNQHPIHAIRFEVARSVLIGDGIVVATPFGSTGYFKSITTQTFDKGFGVAFNNTTKKTPALFLKDQDTVSFKLKRGKATLSFDNSPEIFYLDEGSELIFKLSDKTAKIYEDTSLRCPNCKTIRD